jgi:hypothetical protein
MRNNYYVFLTGEERAQIMRERLKNKKKMANVKFRRLFIRVVKN